MDKELLKDIKERSIKTFFETFLSSLTCLGTTGICNMNFKDLEMYILCAFISSISACCSALINTLQKKGSNKNEIK